MTRIECPGLDGSNPLHFLASLGVLRILSIADSSTGMLWKNQGSSLMPCFERDANWDLLGATEELTKWLCLLGKVAVASPQDQKQASSLSAKVKKLDNDIKDAVKRQKSEWKVTRPSLKGRDFNGAIHEKFKDEEAKLTSLRQELSIAQFKVGDALGSGVAHLGDIIGISSSLFRSKAEMAAKLDVVGAGVRKPRVDDPQLVTAMIAALGCDLIEEEGKVVPTPFSFANGSSGQCLLKAFREAADRVTQEATLGCLQGQPVYSREISSLGWDPSDQGSYAMQWTSPEESNKKGNKDVDPSLQVLGYLGLSFLPALPIANELVAVGFVPGRGKGFIWPLWDCPLRSDVIASLLSSDLNRHQPGVVDLRKSLVQNPNGKRNFFAPSRSL